MTKNVEKFNRNYFLKLKTQEEREKYVMDFIKRSIDKMEKGGTAYDNGLHTNRSNGC